MEDIIFPFVDKELEAQKDNTTGPVFTSSKKWWNQDMILGSLTSETALSATMMSWWDQSKLEGLPPLGVQGQGGSTVQSSGPKENGVPGNTLDKTLKLESVMEHLPEWL